MKGSLKASHVIVFVCGFAGGGLLGYSIRGVTNPVSPLAPEHSPEDASLTGDEGHRLGRRVVSAPTIDASRATLRACEDQLEGALERALACESKSSPEASDGLPSFGLSQDDLAEMVERCEVRYDSPAEFSDQVAERLGLTPKEKTAYRESYAATQKIVRARQEAVLRAVFGETGKGALSPSDMANLALQLPRTPGDDLIAKRIAEERAGLRQPPNEREFAQLSPREQWERIEAAEGDIMQNELAQRLDDVRADELRRQTGGWTGARTMSSGCPEEELE